MWRDYFPLAEVVGLDVNPHSVREAEDRPRILTGCVDQRNIAQLRAAVDVYGKDFDLIVDDGSHNGHDQAQTAYVLTPYLSPQGIYIIEDIDNPAEIRNLLKFDHTIISHSGGGRAAIVYV